MRFHRADGVAAAAASSLAANVDRRQLVDHGALVTKLRRTGLPTCYMDRTGWDSSLSAGRPRLDRPSPHACEGFQRGLGPHPSIACSVSCPPFFVFQGSMVSIET